MVWDEATIVLDRLNQTAASEATLIQLAVSSVLSKKAFGRFKDTIKRMTGVKDGKKT